MTNLEKKKSYNTDERCGLCGAFRGWEQEQSTEAGEGDIYSVCNNTKSYLHPKESDYIPEEAATP